MSQRLTFNTTTLTGVLSFDTWLWILGSHSACSVHHWIKFSSEPKLIRQHTLVPNNINLSSLFTAAQSGWFSRVARAIKCCERASIHLCNELTPVRTFIHASTAQTLGFQLRSCLFAYLLQWGVARHVDCEQIWNITGRSAMKAAFKTKVIKLFKALMA